MLGDHGQMLGFLCLLDLVENKYWEYSRKPFKRSNKKAFTNAVNANFSMICNEIGSKFKTSGTK